MGAEAVPEPFGQWVQAVEGFQQHIWHFQEQCGDPWMVCGAGNGVSYLPRPQPVIQACQGIPGRGCLGLGPAQFILLCSLLLSWCQQLQGQMEISC